MKKLKVAAVGASMRSVPHVAELLKNYSATHEIVAVMDIEQGKMRSWNETLHINVRMFTDFERMCEETCPDLLLITTVDCFHAEYVIKALNKKIGVLVEKPLCINLEQCRGILAAQRRNIEVFAATLHNVRYGVVAGKLKELLKSGAIGKVHSFQYNEMLDLRHGLSYFRRWNSRKKLSGGLQIHKSSHHFDLLNFLMESRVKTVMASGALINYGSKAGVAYAHHCHQCSSPCQWKSEEDPFFFRYKDENSYTPDMCIYSSDIDIEDYISACLEFENGVFGSYNLTAHANYEGEHIVFEGEKGRIEVQKRTVRTLGDSGSLHDESCQTEIEMKIFHFCGETEHIQLESGSGGHGGADNRLYDDIFTGRASETMATLSDGIQAVLVGIAINESMEQATRINVRSLL